MTRPLRIRPEAELDLAEACRWYDEQSSGLSDDFLSEVGDTLRRIDENPSLYPKVHRQLRRALVHRFPFGVYYLDLQDAVVVLAVFHQAQDPRRWRARLP